ncbi:CRISPR-associated endonuclease Cas1 [uncultured Lamprocystis sp.]|uniref:CRISPR-associated endonuclease Cas1 n=1 Tax=uncultured Lamprocystis sp. TaxID=543132 RepID=UPI0025F97454|nr:CRISPR-associated endonuclease Cas1 [uncultured Lamprocystis sp.]
MSTLYLDRRNCALDLEGRVLVVSVDGVRETTVPLHLLGRVVLRSNVTLGSSLLPRLAAAGIAVIAFGGRFGRHHATVLGATHNDAARRVGQLRAYDDPVFRSRWSRRLCLGKIRAQRRLLNQAAAVRPDQRHALTKALDAQDQALARLRAEPGLDAGQLRGIEGAAAAGFFHGYTQLFAPALDFTGRNRRPPRDPVNAALSLGYTLLHAEAVHAAHLAGLDPMVGFYHELDFGRPSLASDLIEPLRGQVEQWVWESFRERLLRLEDFTRDGDACLLGKNARQRYFAAYEIFARPRRRLLRRWCTKLAVLLGERGRPHATATATATE